MSARSRVRSAFSLLNSAGNLHQQLSPATSEGRAREHRPLQSATRSLNPPGYRLSSCRETGRPSIPSPARHQALLQRALKVYRPYGIPSLAGSQEAPPGLHSVRCHASDPRRSRLATGQRSLLQGNCERGEHSLFGNELGQWIQLRKPGPLLPQHLRRHHRPLVPLARPRSQLDSASASTT